MADLSKDFGASFNLLSHQKKIIIPMSLAIIIPIILIYAFLNISGLNPLLKELGALKNDFDAQKTDYLFNTSNINDSEYTQELASYIDKDSQNSKYTDDFSTYLEQRGYDWNNYSNLINVRNIFILIIIILLGFIASFYFSCMSYAIITLAIRGESTENIFTLTNQVLLKLFSLRLLTLIIILVPLIVLAGISISLFFLNKIFGFLSLVLFSLVFLGYCIYIAFRLIFIAPSMYMENNSATNSIKHSFKITNMFAKQITILFFIIWGMSIFLNSFIAQPLQNISSSVVLEESFFKLLINILLLVLFVALEAFVFTFEQIFLFYSYIDFKQEVEKNGR